MSTPVQCTNSDFGSKHSSTSVSYPLLAKFLELLLDVVTKKLRRWVIDPPLQNQLEGGEPYNEHPYAEISVMQQHGDHQHTFRYHEVLWDIDFLLPWVLDESYLFFIIQRGLENEALCDRRLEELFRHGGEETLLSRLIQVVQELDPVARKLLQQLLSPNPQNRPEVDEIINHQFFHGVA